MPRIVVNGTDVETALGTVASAGTIPIGGIIPWMSPVLGAPQPTPPTGYEYCDGTAVATMGSPLLGVNKPALMKTVASPGVTQRFIRGGNTNVAYGGATPLAYSGNDSHSHSGSTDSQGNHSHNVGPHTHTIGVDSHTHSGTGGAIFNNGFPAGALTTHLHDHGGSTGSSSPTTDFQGNHGHNLNVNSSGNVPSCVELAYIIRVL